MPIMIGFSQHRRQLLEAELRRALEEMPQLGAERIYLTGGMALGHVGPETELELVIVQRTDEPFHRRADFWASHLRPRVATRYTVYTPDEVDSLAETDPLLISALAYGEPVHGG